jgi:hypothetical protein
MSQNPWKVALATLAGFEASMAASRRNREGSAGRPSIRRLPTRPAVMGARRPGGRAVRTMVATSSGTGMGTEDPNGEGSREGPHRLGDDALGELEDH